jgi:hypothetical protein
MTPPTLSSLSCLSTLWVPLDETTQQWATFAQEAIRHLIEQATLHQGRRRALHRQVLGGYASVKQHGRKPQQREEEQL